MPYLVPTFHHDICYLRSEKVYTNGCMMILDEALRILSANPEYHFFVEQSWLLEEYWDARPEKRDQMRRLAQEGRLCIEPGLYAVPDMTLPDGESLYMHAAIGRKIVKETLGIEPRVCMIADCWGHHSQLPQIMSQCGYDYYAFSRCMRHDIDRQNFIWRGADEDSKLRVHWMSTHYDGIRFPTNVKAENAGELEWAEAGEKGISELMARNREKCGDDPQYLPVGGDMCYPAASAPEIVRKLNERGVLPKLKFASPSEALDAVDWENAAEYTGDFMSSQQGSFTTNIWIKQKDRQYSGELFVLEALDAALKSNKDFSLAWRLHLKNQFHDIICGTICNDAYRDIESDFRALGHLLTQIKRELTGGAGEQAYFNVLPFERSIRTPQGRLLLPALGTAKADEAVNVPSCSKMPALPLSFENEWYSAQLDKDGYITSLVEKSTRKELVSSTDANGKSVPFGALTMQRDYGDNWWCFAAPNLNRVTQAYTVNLPDPLFREDSQTFLPVIKEAKVEQADADCIVIRQNGKVAFWMMNIEFTTTITLSKSVREIVYHTEFVNTAKNLRLRVAFPVHELTERRRQIPYAIVPFGEGEQTTQMFMDAQNEDAGLAVINKGMPAGNIEDGVMLLSLFRSAAMEYKCESDLSYNLGRDFAFDYAVCPHAAGDDESVWHSALCMNTPVIPCHPFPKRNLPKIEGALISGIRDTAEGIFVRLYNPFETEKCCNIILPEGCSRICFTDGLGNMDSACEPLDGSAVSFVLNARKVQGILCC